MARRKGTFRSSRKSGNKVWSTVLLQEVAVTAATLSSTIVDDADWVVIAGLKSATVLGVRGYISVSVGDGTQLSNNLAMYVAPQNEDTSPAPPTQVSTYSDESIMWTGGRQQGEFATESQYYDINIKAKRRIISGTELRFVFAASADGQFIVSACLRAILLLDNN